MVIDCFTVMESLVIMYFSAEEELKVISILNDLGLSENDDIILIDARNDNKSSASNVKIEKSI